MPDAKAKAELAGMVGEIYELIKIAYATRARARSGQPEQLTEAEFLAMDTLAQQESMTVGEVQKQIGVLPAQMSRIVRSLESKSPQPFVACSINTQDRRKIDVGITPQGTKAYETYRAARLSFVTNMLSDLSPADRQLLMRITRRIRDGLAKRLDSVQPE